VNYWSVAAYCNTWRFAGDVLPQWKIILEIMDYYASMQNQLTRVVGPGAWNDADLVDKEFYLFPIKCEK